MICLGIFPGFPAEDSSMDSSGAFPTEGSSRNYSCGLLHEILLSIFSEIPSGLLKENLSTAVSRES